MADNYVANAGSGGDTFAADDIGGVKYPRNKCSYGRDGDASDAGSAFKRISTADTNGAVVKASAGVLYLIVAVNINAAVRYLKLYNKATTPTVGTDTPVLTIPIPGNAAGAGVSIPVPCGLDFATGIGMGLTTGIADSNTGAVAANEIAVSMVYV